MFTADLYGKTRRVINRKVPLALLEKEKGSLEKPIGSGGKKRSKKTHLRFPDEEKNILFSSAPDTNDLHGGGGRKCFFSLVEKNNSPRFP